MVPSGPSRPILRTRRQFQHRLSRQEAQDLANAYASGSTIKELAARFHINRTTVMSILQRHGTKTRYRLLDDEQIDRVAALYVSGISLSRLSHEFAVSIETVRNALLRAGAQLRPRPGWK